MSWNDSHGVLLSFLFNVSYGSMCRKWLWKILNLFIFSLPSPQPCCFLRFFIKFLIEFPFLLKGYKAQWATFDREGWPEYPWIFIDTGAKRAAAWMYHTTKVNIYQRVIFQPQGRCESCSSFIHLRCLCRLSRHFWAWGGGRDNKGSEYKAALIYCLLIRQQYSLENRILISPMCVSVVCY